MNESGNSVNHPILGDRLLFLGRRGIRLLRNRLESEDVLLEEALLDKLLQISSESTTMDGMVPLTVVERAILLRPRQ